MPKTIVSVVFRKWPNGDIIALFPEIPADMEGLCCQSYEHVGQSGAAQYDHVISKTRPASIGEFKPLFTELAINSYTFRPFIRRTPKMRAKYQTALTEMKKEAT